MKISIITLFPEVFNPYLATSILKRAQDKSKVSFEIINLRNFGEGKHKTVDGKPYGGGAGMILKPDILARALMSIIDSNFKIKNLKLKIVLMSASGKLFTQQKAQHLSTINHLVIVCGHYEGVDQRFIDKYVDEEISIGDYVLTGGEIPAMVIADAVTRLLPGVLEKSEAIQNESFSNYTLDAKPYTLLEHPHYTRPEKFEGKKVPAVLLSGNHSKIKEWRQKKSLEKTKKLRPELLKRVAVQN